METLPPIFILLSSYSSIAELRELWDSMPDDVITLPTLMEFKRKTGHFSPFDETLM